MDVVLQNRDSPSGVPLTPLPSGVRMPSAVKAKTSISHKPDRERSISSIFRTLPKTDKKSGPLARGRTASCVFLQTDFHRATNAALKKILPDSRQESKSVEEQDASMEKEKQTARPLPGNQPDSALDGLQARPASRES